MSVREEMKKRILEVIKERGDICMGVDGYNVYWPIRKAVGAINAEELRIIAEILDEMNKGWDEEVQRGLSK